MEHAGNILILGNYNSSRNVYYSEIETFLGLKKNRFNVVIAGEGSQEIQNYFKQNQIMFITIKPQKKFDKKFAQQISQIISENKIDILYVRNGKLLRSFLTFIKKTDYKIVTYYGSASLHWHDPFAYLSYLNPKIDYIIGNSNFVYNHVKKQLFGKTKQKVIKIYKGYSSHWFKDVKPFDYTTFKISNQAIKVIMVARNSKVKDIPTFLKIAQQFKENKNVHFILVGEKLTQEHLSKNSTFKNQENLHLLGFRKDAPSLIKGADIYIQTSISEGLGRAISEAAGMGKPVVLTQAGGCTELINESQSGYSVSVGDYKQLAKRIKELAENPDLRQKMGENALQKIKTDLSVEKTIQDFSQFFKQIQSCNKL